jgi:uncharacterized damage-inducible protein DinB
MRLFLCSTSVGALLPRMLTVAVLFLAGAALLPSQQTSEAQQSQQSQQPPQPTAAQLSKQETVASAMLRSIAYQEYQVRSAAEAMPEEKYGYRPAEGQFKDSKPAFGPAEMRTFGEQVKHVACANFAFASEFDGQPAPKGCEQGGPDPAKTRRELLIYLRNSFQAIRKSIARINAQNQFNPIEGDYGMPNTRLGLAGVVIWHNADHYGQMIVYLRLNGIVPPASRPNPPPVKETY